jgi:post-segregation antitoxin (ccd killing protein)
LWERGPSRTKDTVKRQQGNIVRSRRAERWIEEGRSALASINVFIDRHGLLASTLRYRPDADS